MRKVKALNLNLAKLIMIALLFFGVSGEAFAATYYVSPSGNDSSSGLIGTPFKTIQHAADIVNPGDTVIVKDGSYTSANTYMLTISRSGTSSNWITFKSENKWGAVLDGQNTSDAAILFSANASYINIEGFEIKNVLYNGALSSYNSSSSNIYFYGNKIHAVGRQQVPCTDPYGRSGVSFNTGTTSYLTMDSNIFYDIGRLPGGCTSPAWQDYNRDHGMYVGTNHTTVINNIFYNCLAGFPIQIYGSIAGGTSDWLIANNTFYGTNPYNLPGHIFFDGNPSNVTIENNISYGSYGGFLNLVYSTPSNLLVDNNLVDGNSLVNPSGITFTQSGNLTSQDPKFVDLANKDFHLQSGSPAIAKGISTGLTYDIEGKARVGIPDIGAYEYAGTQTDTTSPSVPAGLTAASASTSQINLSWTASSDNVGVTGYKVYRNGTQIATATASSYSDTGLAASTSYTYTVSAFDAAGNVSGQSASVSAKTMTPSDTQAPTVPAGLTATIASTSQINLAWTASTDNVGVTGYKIYKNGNLVATVSTTAYSDTGLAASTSYTYTVSAYDAAGNVSGQSSPASATTQAAATPVQLVSATETLSSPVAAGTAIKITGQASGGSGSYAYQFWVGDPSGKWSAMQGYSAANTYNWTPSQIGQYQIQVWAKNAGSAANYEAYTSINYTVQSTSDTQAPTVPANLTATAVSSSQINLSWAASTDNLGVTGYKVYRNGTQIATATTTLYSDTGLTASTSYTYTVSASDAAGNVSAQSASVASVSATAMTQPDTQAPTVPSGLKATSVSTSQINLTWTASTDNIGVTSYNVYRNGTQIATATTTSYSNTGLAASTSYTYTVSASDAAGNASGQSVSVSARTQRRRR